MGTLRARLKKVRVFKKRRGFTLIELLTMVAVTTIGFIALLNLQIQTIRGIGNARDMQLALTLADTIAQTLRLEALQWTPAVTVSGNTNFNFLSKAPNDTTEGSTSDWFVAFATNDKTDLRVAPVGDSLPLGIQKLNEGILHEYTDANTSHTFDKRFCAHVRLTWLVPDVLLRADIRVFWPKHRANEVSLERCAIKSGGIGADPALLQRPDQIQMISVPVTVIRNVFVRQV